MRPALDTAAHRHLAREASFELARRSLPEFCALTDARFELTPHTKAILDHLEALERRDIDRLFIALPPRHSKTYLSSERFPAWMIGRSPQSNFILASYGAELAERNSRRARELLKSDAWPFETRLSEESAAVNRWSTSDGGTLVAVGIGGGLTGFGADGALIIDDPVRDREAADSKAIRDSTWTWYQEVARTRLMARGVQLLCQTRWHEDDLAGRILNSKGGKRWTMLVLPAIAEEADPLGRAIGEPLWPAMPLPSVDEGEISSRSWAALYQQRPAPVDGNTFKAAWLEQRYTVIPDDARIIQAIDGAWKTGVANDFSVIATWAGTKTHFYLVDVWRQRAELPALIAAAVAQYDLHHPTEIIIEDAASGIGLLQVLKRETNLPIIAVPTRGSKESRAEAVTPAFESGRVLLPSIAAPWLDIWLEEHLRFPSAAHDDTVDTTAMALSRLQRPTADFSWGKISVSIGDRIDTVRIQS